MPLFIYGDESGEVGGKFFLVGLLYVTGGRSKEYERQIREIKLAHSFRHREMHYHDLSDDRLPFAKALVDWYLSAEATDIVFKCTIVEQAKFDVARFRGNTKFVSAEELSYNVIYKSTILHHMPRGLEDTDKVIIVDKKDKARPDEFDGFVRRNVPGVVDFQEALSENHNLLQLADLLVGCVNGDLNGVQKFSKRAVIEHIKLHLGVRDFRERNHYTKEKFVVAFWKPPTEKNAQRQPRLPI